MLYLEAGVGRSTHADSVGGRTSRQFLAPRPPPLQRLVVRMLPTSRERAHLTSRDCKLRQRGEWGERRMLVSDKLHCDCQTNILVSNTL